MPDILDSLATEVDKIDESSLNQEPIEAPADPKSSAKKKTDNDKDDSVMSQLLSDGGEISFPKVGDSITGKVLEISSNEIYLDLTPFGTGMVMGKEIKDGMGTGKVKIGDEVSAIVTDLENEDGFIELSIREASQEKAWDDIESKRDVQENIPTKITSVNKGGLLVEINGISGFLPVSQLSSKNYPRVDDGDKNKILQLLKKLQGQEITVRILDADRETEKLIVSEKAAQSDKDREVISALSVGDIVDGEVSGVVDFGAFVKFLPKNATTVSEEEKLEGLVHISELAWQLIENPRNIIKVGDRVKAKIIGIDADKISLSIRALQTDPWSEIDEKYKIGDSVKGTVNKLNHFGAFVYLDENIHGLAHISEMSQAFPGKSLEDLIKVGEKYDWKILSIEPKEHRMGLILISGKKEKKSEKAKDSDVAEAKEEKKKEPKKTAKKEPEKEK